MCRVAIYENSDCGCRWLQIHQQCRANAGFSQCEHFGKGSITYYPDEYQSSQCPVHGLYGWYDRNYVRMIVKEKKSLKFGTGPGKGDPGFKVGCAVM